jgi:hypothetical protein
MTRRKRTRRVRRVKRKAVKAAATTADQLAIPALDDALAEGNRPLRCACGITGRMIAGALPYGWRADPPRCPSCVEAEPKQPNPDCPWCGGSGELPVYDMGDPAINMGWPVPCDCVRR